MAKWIGSLVGLATPTNAEEFWTMVTGLTSIAVLVVAWRGLRSLSLTHHDLVTRAKRDARQCAIARAEEWANEIIPLNGTTLTLIAQHQVPVFVQKGWAVTFDPDSKEHLDAARKWAAALPPDVYGHSLTVLNRIEAWAMYFTNQLADWKIAFKPCAPSYCSIMIQNYALLLLMRADKASGKYPNAVKLFKVWVAELEEAERGLKKGNLLRQLSALQKEGPANAETLPDPLGMELDPRR